MSAQEIQDVVAQRLAAIRARVAAPPLLPQTCPAAVTIRPSLDGIAMLQSLSDEERQALARQCTIRRFAAGELVAARFSPGNTVFFLVSGAVRNLHNLGEAGEVTIATVGAGQVLGEIAAIDGEGRSTALVAETECVVMELPGKAFNALLEGHAEVARAVLLRWAALIRQLDVKVSTLAVGGPEQRVCGELVRLAATPAADGQSRVILDLPCHRELAMWAHASREVVVKALADLVRQGIIERRANALRIHDYERLRRCAAGEESLAEPGAERLSA